MRVPHRKGLPHRDGSQTFGSPARLKESGQTHTASTYVADEVLISHVPGKDITTADVLSRAPITAEGLQKEEVSLYVDMIMANLPATDKRLRNPSGQKHSIPHT